VNRPQANFCGGCGHGLRDAAEPPVVATTGPWVSPRDEPEDVPDADPAAEMARPGQPSREGEYQPGELAELARLERMLEYEDRARAERQRRRRARRYVAVAAAVTGAIGVMLFTGPPWRTRPPGEISGKTIVVPAQPATSRETTPGTPMASPPAPSFPASRSSAPAPQPSDASPSTDASAGAASSPPPAPPPAKQEPPGAAEPPEAAAPAAAPTPPPAIPDEPRAGGELTVLVPGEPPSYDAHREETFALMHPAAPHYNTLLRIDPTDPGGTRVVGDLAESWAVSPDKRTYILKLRRGVTFHDGSEMTSRDVKATYDKIIWPPAGTTSARRGEYLEIELVLAPERYIVAFKLKWPAPSFIHSLASPWNWIYKADILERDPRWYEKHVMGTGPFVFVEHVKGSHWVGRRNPRYWDRRKPYLDGYRALFVRDDAAQVSAIRAGRAHIQFRGFSPAQRDRIVRTLGDKATVQESAWNCGLVVALNHEKPPFNDRRVRRALSLALDRYRAAAALSRIAIVREVAGVQVPGSPFASSPAQLAELAGYWRDIERSRAEARRLLAEAGVPEGFSFVLKNRNIPMPYEYIGTWLVDQWRRIDLNVRQEIQESGAYFADLRSGSFEAGVDFQCGYVVDPDLDLYKFQSRSRSHANYGRYEDPVLDDLYVLQSRTVDPEQRRRHIRAFERRLLDEEAHYIYTLQWHRIVPHSARVRGWTITPSHYLNNQLDTVWLAEE
jgi:peptide/nickel transport system substrate-binding protein